MCTTTGLSAEAVVDAEVVRGDVLDDVLEETPAEKLVDGVDPDLEVPDAEQEERRSSAATKAGSRRADVNGAPHRRRCCLRSGGLPGRTGPRT